MANKSQESYDVHSALQRALDLVQAKMDLGAPEQYVSYAVTVAQAIIAAEAALKEVNPNL